MDIKADFIDPLVLTTEYSSDGRSELPPYYDFSIRRDDNGKWGILDDSGNWIEKGWHILRPHNSMANWIEAMRVVKYPSKDKDQFEIEMTVGIIQICHDQKKNKVVWEWIRNNRWIMKDRQKL